MNCFLLISALYAACAGSNDQMYLFTNPPVVMRQPNNDGAIQLTREGADAFGYTYTNQQGQTIQEGEATTGTWIADVDNYPIYTPTPAEIIASDTVNVVVTETATVTEIPMQQTYTPQAPAYEGAPFQPFVNPQTRYAAAPAQQSAPMAFQGQAAQGNGTFVGEVLPGGGTIVGVATPEQSAMILGTSNQNAIAEAQEQPATATTAAATGAAAKDKSGQKSDSNGKKKDSSNNKNNKKSSKSNGVGAMAIGSILAAFSAAFFLI